MNIRSIGYNSVYAGSYSFQAEVEMGVYMLVLTKSRACFWVNGECISAAPNSLIIYDDTCERQYAADAAPLVCDWICFDAEDESEFIDALKLPLNRVIPHCDSETIDVLMRNIMTEFYSLGSARIKMLDALMRTLLAKAGETTDRRGELRQTSDPHYSSLIELREKIYRNPQLKWNVDTMAADVNMSRSYFQHIYREVFGVSCISDVISGKIEKAKEILSETDCTVSQVAAMCGYDNEEHFMRQFKKIVGETPTKYRKKK